MTEADNKTSHPCAGCYEMSCDYCDKHEQFVKAKTYKGNEDKERGKCNDNGNRDRSNQ